ncbi:MAG TPA: helix-turn-helix transcriptional regulator [Geomonas sp.]
MEQAFEKTEKTSAPSVAIDGARIKSVREAKKLTQLYVASVVGVTTDTISRWENNRYPSIKRDNAEKLASALEVELGDILRREKVEVGDTPGSAPPPPPGRGARRLLVAGLAALALLFLAIFFLTRHLVPAPTAVRWAPNFGAPGEIIPVQIRLTRPGAEQTGFILKEKIPDGWQLVSSLPASSAADASGSVVKWLIPGGAASVTVSYTVRLPASPALRSEVKLHGEVVLHFAGVNRTESVAGSSSVRIGGYHWADANGDGRIDDDEIMPAYYICEEIKALGPDWRTIEAIWSGKGYRWDSKNGFTILK